MRNVTTIPGLCSALLGMSCMAVEIGLPNYLPHRCGNHYFYRAFIVYNILTDGILAHV